MNAKVFFGLMIITLLALSVGMQTAQAGLSDDCDPTGFSNDDVCYVIQEIEPVEGDDDEYLSKFVIKKG